MPGAPTLEQPSPNLVTTALPTPDQSNAICLPNAFAEAAYWRAQIAWYPDGCFGPYRSPAVGYSRRELAADMIVHALGVAGGAAASLYLLSSLDQGLPAPILNAIRVYLASLMTMLVCSATFNALAWKREHLRMLQLADHIGILCLICGSLTPMMIHAGCTTLLGLNWTAACVSATIKASGSALDVVALHVPLFVGMGWSVVVVWEDFWVHFTPWAKEMCVLTGLLYCAGLVPWACNRLEGHNALWHFFVLVASSTFYLVVLLELSRPSAWMQGGA